MKITQILQKLPKRQIYLDYAAGAPVLPAVARACMRAEMAYLGNPSSIHKLGVASAQALSAARSEIAKVFNARADEIVFVSGGTESDNLAIRGVVARARVDLGNTSPHIITTVIEHPAVLETCRALEQEGVTVTYLSVSQDGLVDLKELRAALRPETVLVSVCYANSEIGVIQPIKEITKEVRHFKKVSGNPSLVYPLVHTDACQAVAYCNVNVEQLGVDLLSANGSKLGGPKGIGLLFVRRATPIAPIITGGGQQSGLRSGSESVADVIGLARALTHATLKKESESARLGGLRDWFFAHVHEYLPEVRINGSLTERLPNAINFSLPTIASELLVLELDARGVSASAGSACSSAKNVGSHTIVALYGEGDALKWGTIRLSMGLATRKADLIYTLKVLKETQQKYKNLV